MPFINQCWLFVIAAPKCSDRITQSCRRPAVLQYDTLYRMKLTQGDYGYLVIATKFGSHSQRGLMYWELVALLVKIGYNAMLNVQFENMSDGTVAKDA
jgi:hypothetical protein